MTRNMNTAQLRGLRDRLASMVPQTWTNIRLTKLCSAAALKLVADEFRYSRAPDGTPWAPVGRMGKKMRRGQYGPRRAGKPLLRTGRLRASFATNATPGGFRIGTAVGYAGYHQTGTSRMVARPMLPGDQLPESWREAFQKALNAAVRQQLSGKAAA